MNAINDLIEKGFVQEGTGGNIILHPMIQETAFAETKPSVKNCIILINNLQNICIRCDKTVPYHLQLFRTAENISELITDDNTEKFLGFLEDCVGYMKCYDYKSGMKFILFKIESILKNPSAGTDFDRAKFRIYRSWLSETPEEQIKELEKAFSFLGETNAENALITAGIYANLGGVYMKAGKYSAAKGAMEQAIEIMKEYHIKNYDFIIQISNYATLLMNTGNFSEAALLYKTVLDYMEQTKTGRTLGTAGILRSLGSIFILHNDYESGNACFKKSLGIYEEIFKNQPEELEEHRRMLSEDYRRIDTIRKYSDKLDKMILGKS